jgi:hypothetical protein
MCRAYGACVAFVHVTQALRPGLTYAAPTALRLGAIFREQAFLRGGGDAGCLLQSFDDVQNSQISSRAIGVGLAALGIGQADLHARSGLFAQFDILQ